jgi:two-component system chemotaxis response regulator CheB
MPERDIVVIGASAGGLEPLKTIIDGLHGAPPMAVLVVTHTGATNGSVLPQILARQSPWTVALATDGETLQHGRIYVARPDCHLMLTRSGLSVSHGPRENGFRPAIDPLFRTAARVYGPRVIGVLLSGALDDGTYGLSVVKENGGLAVVQHPDDAVVPSMPLSAIRHVEVDYILPSREIAPLIASLGGGPVQGASAMAGSKDQESQLPEVEVEISEMERDLGPPTGLTCPDCGGALWELQDGKIVRYKCHVGHQYSPDALASEQSELVEGALWTAVRVLEEHAELRMRLSQRAEAAGIMSVSQGFAESARESQAQAHQIRALLFDHSFDTAEAEPAGTGRPVAKRAQSADRPRSKRKARATTR